VGENNPGNAEAVGPATVPAVAAGRPEHAEPSGATAPKLPLHAPSAPDSAVDGRSALDILAAAAPQLGPPPAGARAADNGPQRGSTWRRGWRPGAWLRVALDFIAEKRFASRRSRNLLQLYERIRIGAPQLKGKDLYARVVIESGLDPREAQGVLLRAEQSFCQWPTDHDLRFGDVVRYVVVTEYLRSHAASLGTHTNMGEVVARVVPEDL
jgi:hypothetical protein